MRVLGTVEWHNGRWRVRAYVGGKRKTLGTFDTRGAALEFRAAVSNELNAPKRAVTFGEWIEEWAAGLDATHRDADGTRRIVRAHVLGSSLARVPLSRVSEHDVRDWIRSIAHTKSQLTGGARQLTTIRNTLSCVSSALAAAAEGKHIPSNPALGVSAPPPLVTAFENQDEETLFLSTDEIASVLALDLRIGQRVAFVVGVYAGLRAGELAGMRWGDLVLDEQRPEIIVRRGRKLGPKGKRVLRVPLLAPAAAILRQYRDSLDEDAKKPDRLVLPSPTGHVYARGYDWGWVTHIDRKHGPKHAGGVRVRDGIAERAGIRTGITWHAATRHTCATHLELGTWVPDLLDRPLTREEVARWLRHSSTKATERYAHVTTGRLTSIVTSPAATPVATPEPPSSGMSHETKKAETPQDFSLFHQSHFRELNSGPTVYETVAPSPESQGNPGNGVRGRDLRTQAADLLSAVEARSPYVAMLAVDLAARVLREVASEDECETGEKRAG